MGQLESPHYFRENDAVRHQGGSYGTVVQQLSLYARIRWDDGSEGEVEQFDPTILVVERAPSG